MKYKVARFTDMEDMVAFLNAKVIPRQDIVSIRHGRMDVYKLTLYELVYVVGEDEE